MYWPGLYNFSGYIVFLAELRQVMCSWCSRCVLDVWVAVETFSKWKRNGFLQNLHWLEELGRAGHECCPCANLLGDTQHLAARVLPGKSVVREDVYGTDWPFTWPLFPKCRKSICGLWSKTWSLRSFVEVLLLGARRSSPMERRQKSPGDRVGTGVWKGHGFWGESDLYLTVILGLPLMCCDWTLP